MLLYESLTTVLAALLLGIGIGLLIAFTLTAQFYLFLELPIRLSVSYIFFDLPLVPNNVIHSDDCSVIDHNSCGCFASSVFRLE
jgi:hypothetical protein